MSQKTTRRTTQLQTTIVTSSSPAAGEMLTNARSPFSPTCLSRQDEKNKLQHLNDRLAQYIDRVRSLEVENQRLSLVIKSSEETLERTCSGIKTTYAKELADARQLGDELAREKARLQMELGKKTLALDELAKRQASADKELKDKADHLARLQTTYSKMERDLSEAVEKCKSAVGESKQLKQQNGSLVDQVAKLQAALERESLNQVDLKNQLNSLRDELAFEKSMHQKEMVEARSHREVVLSEVNEKLDTEYQKRLQEELSQMRQELDAQIKQNRLEVENMYEKKLAGVRSAADGHLEVKYKAENEVKRVRNELTSIEAERNRFVSELVAAKNRLKNHEKEMNTLRDSLQSSLISKDAEIELLRTEVAQMMKEYKDLMDVKVSLVAEIEAYRHLLEGEERRLNLTPTSVSEPTSEGSRPTKRRRLWRDSDEEAQEAVTTTEADSVGDLQVSDHDASSGRYVTVQNNGKEDASLGGWTLSRKAGGSEVTYKFHPKIVLKAQKQLTVWSSNSKVEHHPPNDLVMKNQDWPCGKKVHSTLLDADGKEAAWRVTRTEFRTSRPSSNGCSVM